jgi:ribonuclease J
MKTDGVFHADPGELLFLPLGGSNEIGMNLNLYCYGGKWLMVDLGITFGDETTPGVDVIMPDPSFVESRREDLLGLVVTHGHEDHIGAIPYLWERLRCPIYATPFTASLVRRKLADVDLVGQVELIEVPLSGSVTLGPFDIEFIGLTHSIPEPSAIVLRCEAGTILHTGDWKFDPAPQVGEVTDLAALEALAEEGVLAMVGDSTNVDVPGSTGSEAELVDSFSELFAKQEHRIAVTCFASNVARLHSIAVAARRHDRRVALVGRSLWRMHDVARENGYLLDIPDFVSEADVGYFPRNKLVLICTGSQGESRAALARIADQAHPKVSIEAGDTVIFSSREIPGNENAIGRVQGKFMSRDVKVITERDHHVHVSGHPAHDDMVRMYQMVRPEIAIPVHGDARHLAEHARLAHDCQVPQVQAPGNGSVIRLAPGPAEIISWVPVSSLAVDGPRLRQLNGEVIRDRRKLLHNGAVAATLILDKKGYCRLDPMLTVTGITDDDDDEAEEIDDLLVEMVRKSVDGLSSSARASDEAVVAAAYRAVRRVLRNEFGKRPLTTVHVVRG